MTLDFRSHRTGPELAPYVRMLWTVNGPDASAQGEATQCIPPDGCMEIVLHLASDVEEVRAEGARIQPRALLVGESARPSRVRPLGELDIVGVRLTPAGVRAFVDAPAHELVGNTFALDSVLDAETRKALATVEAAEPRDRLKLLEAALVAKVRRARRHDVVVARLVRQLETPAGATTTIESLAADVGMTRRQLERRFLDAVGLSPKLLAQVLRFQRVLSALSAGGVTSRTDLAHAYGYYDQAHLIRDFRRFTSMSPREFLGRDHPFADLFVPAEPTDVASVQSSIRVTV